MTDEEWQEFVDWWKTQWVSTPNRQSVEQYLKWLSLKSK